MYHWDVEGRRHRGRLCFSWFDGVKKTSNAMSVEQIDAKAKCVKREQLRNFVNAANGGMNV